MKILVYENRKSDQIYYDASTPEKEMASYLLIFKMLDEEWDVYCDLTEYTLNHPKDYRTKQKQWYEAAKSGDANAAKILIRERSRSNYEYESVITANVLVPLV